MKEAIEKIIIGYAFLWDVHVYSKFQRKNSERDFFSMLVSVTIKFLKNDFLLWKIKNLKRALSELSLVNKKNTEVVLDESSSRVL